MAERAPDSTRPPFGGPAGRGSGTRPSAAARRLAPPGRRPPAAPRRRPPEADDPRGPERAGPEAAEQYPGESAEEVDLNSLVSELITAAQMVLGDLRSAAPELLRRAPEWVTGAVDDPWTAAAELAERFGVDFPGSVSETVAFARRRMAGDYSVDGFGFDPEFTERVVLPLLRPLVRNWFRVEVSGMENIPDQGPALLVANHAGTLPLDGLVLHSVIFDELGRHTRELGANLIFATPYSHDFARRIGVTYACQEDAARLLDEGHLVAAFPEGFKGLGKPYADRYRLQRFGRGGFVSTAVAAQVPIVPISIVGSEEIYPLLHTAPTLARTLGFPYFPITPLFPWFGVLGMIPLPTKWNIVIGEAITTDELDPHAADDPVTVFNVTNQVRETIQDSLYAQLARRRSVFW